MRTIELYLHMKILLGKAMMDKKDDKEEIMLHLDEIQAQLHLQDLKMNLLAKKIVGMDLSTLSLNDVFVTLDEVQPSNQH
jgi:hypothetical protein